MVRSSSTSGPAAPLRRTIGPLTFRPRRGSGPIDGDTPYRGIFLASDARRFLENLRPSRSRQAIRRTLTRTELEQHLDDVIRARGAAGLNALRDRARAIAQALDAQPEFALLDDLVGALLGTRDVALRSSRARARAGGVGYDPRRLALFESLRAALARQTPVARPAPADPERAFAFYEACFSNWIEGTIFPVEQADAIVFRGLVPSDRPADAHDVQGTFDAILTRGFRGVVPGTPDELERWLAAAHRLVMHGRPEARPGEYKHDRNQAGATVFVAPEDVRGTLREAFPMAAAVPAGLPRAAFLMALITEVHPFADGNGRTARLLMNAELTRVGQTRVMVPLVYRDEYMTALKALSHNELHEPLYRMLDRAQRWAHLVDWSTRTGADRQLTATNALVTPDDARDRNVRLSTRESYAPSLHA